MDTATHPGPVTLYTTRRARVERAKGLAHIVPALVLVSGAAGVLAGNEPFTLLTGLELLVGVAYVGLLWQELRHLKQQPEHHSRVAWLEVAAAGILALEGYHIWHRHHEAEALTGVHRMHVLPWLYAALAVWYVGLAFGIGRIYERRYLHLHPEGFRGRLGLFQKSFAYTWAEVAAAQATGETDVVVRRPDGQQECLSFAGLHNGPTHRAKLLAHIAQHQAPGAATA
ncbi:hypothetical protein HNQ93_003718 [Hymenobacter luteus]|uniref:PH domain-containing protein n=2 Tax=Hymenobacter TaxID=89966 RepID=A0A7W9T4Y5_9BACT|nr:MULTISPECIES: hypothetical protein [Hymenobacter]MBB4602951.1 hypothetical protein [Hymenobacter latericoloratus]MBB6060843.1 hypothetical protein [Hymenobacter luteus]